MINEIQTVKCVLCPLQNEYIELKEICAKCPYNEGFNRTSVKCSYQKPDPLPSEKAQFKEFYSKW